MTKFATAMGIGENHHEIGISIDTNKHGPLIEEFARCVTSTIVKERLGLSYEMVDRFFRSGLLMPRFNLPKLAPVFHPDDITNFEKSVFKHALKVNSIPQGYKPLNKLCGQTKSKIEELLRLAQKGELKTLCFRSGCAGLWSLHADPGDVWDQLEVGPASGFTKPQLKSLLRINDTTISKLERASILDTKPVRHYRNRRQIGMVSGPALRAFLEQYVTLGMLAADKNVQAFHVLTQLEKLGVGPIILSKKCSKIYLRNELESARYKIKSSGQHYGELVARLYQQQSADKQGYPSSKSTTPIQKKRGGYDD